MWPKTGTQTMWTVLKNFGFVSDKLENFQRTNQFSDGYSHDCALFKGHEEYKLLIAVRNPYTRFFSLYSYMMKLSKKNISKEGFQSFLDIHLDNLHSYYCTDFTVRKPDYFVRQEFMFEDYCKIPFINESDLYLSGKLREICNLKMNETAEVSNWKIYFDEKIADRIYYKHIDYFSYFNYDRNSWKA